MVNLIILNTNIDSTASNDIQISNNIDIGSTYQDIENILSNTPTVFTENRGQLKNDDVRFYVQGGNLWFTDDGVWFKLKEGIEVKSRESENPFDPLERMEHLEPMRYRSVVLKQKFVGANMVSPDGKEQLSWYSNFFYGNESSKWRTEVPNYREIYYENIYNGIDLRYYLDKNGLKYDFIVHPGADLQQIRIRYEGSDGLEIDDFGNLVIKTTIEDILDSELFLYQDYDGIRHRVEGKFKVYNDMEYGFEILDEYRLQEVLVIDPLVYLEYSTFIGGSNSEYGQGIALDSTGNVIVTGVTGSSNFPTTTGAYNTSFNGNADIFVVKFNHALSKLLYSTYVGGNGNDLSWDITVDGIGNAFVAGQTNSNNFPTTLGAYDTSLNGNYDVFVVKLNPNGSKLIYSSYIGGSSRDWGNAIVVNGSGHVFITGYTYSSNFPTTVGAYDRIYNNGGDVFILKINPKGSGTSDLLHSTYIGGIEDDRGLDIAIDVNGNAFVTGWTWSKDFPNTTGANDTSHNGRYDCFVLKLNQTMSSLVYSTFIGGNNDEAGYAIAVSSSGNVFVTGYTTSSNFPTTQEAYNITFNGQWDVFVIKLNQTGSKLIYSTYIGGNDRDLGNALVIDLSGNAYITGRTASSDFPTTPVAYDKSCNWTDVFMLKLAPNGSMLIYSTFIGGNSNDYGYGIALDSIGNVFITGETRSPDFPTTTGAYDRWHNDNITSDVFVLKFYFESKIINITSLSLVKDNESTNLIYSRLCPYTFRVNFIYSANLSDLSSVRLTLDPFGSNIKLLWDYSTGQFSKLSDPNNYISLETTSKAHNYFYWWTIDFNVTFNWTYPDEKFNDVQVYAFSTVIPPAWLNVTNLYQVENDLIFNGTLLVKGEDNRTIYEDTLVRGGEILEWTGLTPIYENTTDVYPPADEFDVMVWDEVGSSWVDSPTSGQQFYVETDTINTTYNTTFTYTIKLSNIPPESDRTDETFTIMVSKIPEESDKTNETFDVFIDADNVTFSNVIPANNTWQTNRNVLVSVNITDIGGGVVNSKSVMYMYSTNNGETWSEWRSVPNLKSNVSISVMDYIKLEEGKNNLIKWQAVDSVGNGPTVSDAYRILIDTQYVTFSNARPLITDISSNEEVELSITISDTNSGVDASTIEYSVSEDRGKTWDNWQTIKGYQNDSKIIVEINHTFPNGTDNMLKWRASDIAGNGPTESQPLIIKVNTWVPIKKPKVTLFLPPYGITINNTNVNLKWELEDPSLENVTYDIYFDNDSPPEILEIGLSNTSLIVNDLKDGETYYWRVIPKLGELEGTSSSGVWWFTIVLPKDSIHYKLSLTGPKYISMFPSENKSIELTITNLGTVEDMIKMEIEAGQLSNYITLNDYSILRIMSKSHRSRLININLPDNTQPGIYEVIITAISIDSGEKEKDNHIVTVEIMKPEPNGTEPNGVEPSDTTQETDWTMLILLIIIVITMIIIVLVAVVTKRKKRISEKLLPPGTLTVKPGMLSTPVVSIGEIPATLKIPQLTGTTAINTSQQPTPSIIPTPMLAKTTQIAQAIVPQQVPTAQIPQLPALPPAKPLEKKPEVSATIQTQVPTVVSSPSTPTIATAPSISHGPVVHLPDSKPQPTLETSTQSKPQTKNTNQITQQKD